MKKAGDLRIASFEMFLVVKLPANLNWRIGVDGMPALVEVKNLIVVNSPSVDRNGSPGHRRIEDYFIITALPNIETTAPVNISCPE